MRRRISAMSSETALNACWGFGIAAAIVGAILAGLMALPQEIPQRDEFERVDDAPLLTEMGGEVHRLRDVLGRL